KANLGRIERATIQHAHPRLEFDVRTVRVAREGGVRNTERRHHSKQRLFERWQVGGARAMPVEIDDAQVVVVQIDAFLHLSALAAVRNQIACVVPEVLELRLAASAELFAQTREGGLERATRRPSVVRALQQLLDRV